jgi:hypothetical protein
MLYDPVTDCNEGDIVAPPDLHIYDPDQSPEEEVLHRRDFVPSAALSTHRPNPTATHHGAALPPPTLARVAHPYHRKTHLSSAPSAFCVTLRHDGKAAETAKEVRRALAADVEAAVAETLPANADLWAEKLLPLAWRLRGMPAFMAADAEATAWVAERWRRRAMAAVRALRLAREQVRQRWLCCWRDTAFRMGERPVDDLFAEAVLDEPVPVAGAGKCGLQLQNLARLCRRLGADGQHFFLGCRTAGELLGVSHMTAARHLRRLRRFELIKIIDEGNHETGLASVYAWTRDDGNDTKPEGEDGEP